MPSRNPRISYASAQRIRMELDAVAEVETRALHQRWWSLRFDHSAMEKRFQTYHEECSLVSSRWACGIALATTTVLQTAIFYDLFVLQSHRNPWTIVYVAAGGDTVLLMVFGIFLYASRRVGHFGGYFQLLLLVLGLSMLMLIIVVGLPLAAYETGSDEYHVKLHETRRAHGVTRTLLFLLILLGAVATSWHIQFLTYCVMAACTVIVLGCWIIFCSDYLRCQWHLLTVFIGSILLLGHALYCLERNLRQRFLRVRHLLLENLKLSRQNSTMHKQLSCHVDAVGIGDNHGPEEQRAATTSDDIQGITNAHRKARPITESPAIGESSMGNVLRSLSHLRDRLEHDEQATTELEFVMKTLTSEHDLFLDTWSRQRRATSSLGRSEKAETGWLLLLDNLRRRGDVKQQQIQSPVAFLASALRQTYSASRLSVLTLVETFLPPQSSNRPNQKVWAPDEILKLATTSQELDVFAFADICTHPLTTLLLATLESHRAFMTLPLRIESVADFTQEIESRYQTKNPYHNALHAASVVWDVNFFLKKLEAPKLSPVQLFSALVAAAVHDVNHPGLNNAFLVATTAPLAIKYSDDSVLERMHLAEAFQTCMKDGCDIFEGFTPDLRRQSRSQIISMVLATDLSGHLTLVNRLKSKLYGLHTSELSVGRGEELSDPGATGLLLPDELVLQTVLMMADIGHAMKSFPSHLSWSERVSEEFYRQGDTEREFGIPISPLCDRNTGVERFEKNQIGFIEFVVLPLYGAARDVMPLSGFDEVIANIRANAATWEKRAQTKMASEQSKRKSPSRSVLKSACADGPQDVADVVIDLGADQGIETSRR